MEGQRQAEVQSRKQGKTGTHSRTHLKTRLEDRRKEEGGFDPKVKELGRETDARYKDVVRTGKDAQSLFCSLKERQN